MVLTRKLEAHWLLTLTHVAALWPLAQLAWYYWQGQFMIDPVKEITSRTERAALILLISSLACTPIDIVFGFKQVLRLRRPLGLYAFLYAALHFLTFIGLDYRFELGLIGPALFRQRFVLVGFTAFLVLLSLALTSTQGWRRRLGRHWKRLHRLVYLASALAVVHVMWLAKDVREGGPLRYGVVLGLLLVLRIPGVRKATSDVHYRINPQVRLRE